MMDCWMLNGGRSVNLFGCFVGGWKVWGGGTCCLWLVVDLCQISVKYEGTLI
jgi:hypothetical protein